MLLTVFVVCLVVFVYLHVVYQLKTCDDLEIYELDAPDKRTLEEACNLRQPVTFLFSHPDFVQCTPAVFSYDAFDVNVVDSAGVAVPLPVGKAKTLFEKSRHFTEHNEDFLKETMLRRHFEANDALLRPPMVAVLAYDLIFGARDCTTKLRFSKSYRNYMVVISGDVLIKLAPPRNSRYLDPITDYDVPEFYSTFDAWTANADAKVKFLETKVATGTAISVPAYWWYTLRLGQDACVAVFQYKTAMNVVATLPDIAMGILQRQNTKVVTVKSVE